MRKSMSFVFAMFMAVVLSTGAAFAGDGPSGFPLPKDAKAGGPAPGGGGKIVMYEVPRARDKVAEEVKELLKKDGWKIDSEEKSPRGSVRMVVSKDKVSIKVSVAGEGDKAGLILTLP